MKKGQPLQASAAFVVLLLCSNVEGSSRSLLQTATIASIGPCPDGAGATRALMDVLTPGLATIRRRHGAGRVGHEPALFARALQHLQTSNACSNINNPAPTYNSTEGLLGVGYAAVGNPVARAYKCMQGLNRWYSASTQFSFSTANPVADNGLPGDLQQTSDALAMTAMIWNSTQTFGCALAVCSDNFHTEMYCFFRDPTGTLPLLLENQAAIANGDATLRAEVDAIVSTSVLPPIGPCPTPYTTRTGDTLQSIAAQFNISQSDLVCFNRQVASTVQIGLGNIPLLIPCPRIPIAMCPEWEFINGPAPTTMLQTPMDDFSTAAARFGNSASDVCCYNPYYNLTAVSGGNCGAPPLFNGTLSYFMVPSRQELLDRNCNTSAVVTAQRPATPLDCPDKDTTLSMFNLYRRRFFLTEVKWDETLVVQAKELARNSEYCSRPYDPRVTVSLGVSLFSAAARPQCTSLPISIWGLFMGAASQLGLWNAPDNFQDFVPAGLQVVTRYLPRNATSAMGCAMQFCNPYWTHATCVFSANDNSSAPRTSPTSTAGRRLRSSLSQDVLGAFDVVDVRGRLMQAMPTGPPKAAQAPPEAASCPMSTGPMMGDTLNSFAARYNTTPKEIMCFGNQMRNLNGEFQSLWMLGTPLGIPCPNSMTENQTCPEWDLLQGQCDIPYLVYPGDSPATVAQIANRISNNTLNVTAAEICCYNLGVGAVVNNSCAFNLVGTNITIPCRSSLQTSGCTPEAIQQAVAAAAAGSGSSSDLGLILGLSIGIPAVVLLLALVAFLLYRRRAAAAGAGPVGSKGLADPFAKNMDVDDDLPKGKYILEEGSKIETTNSIIMFGKQRTGAMAGVVLKCFKNEESFSHERLFYTDYSNPQFFPECYDARNKSEEHLPCIVMERGDHCLRHWIKQGGNTSAGARVKAHVKAILADIGDGLRCLHSRGIVHGDVKPENVLFFTRSHRWKLIDFATWSKVDDSIVPSYSLRYSAPEVVTAAVNGKALPSKPSQDMWSLGMVMWECLVGEHMLAEYKDSQVADMLTGQSPMPFEDDPSLWQAIKEEPARRLLHALLQRKPNFRWDIGRVMENAFFREGEDTVMTYRKFQAISESQGAVLNKLDEVASKMSLLQPCTMEKVSSQPNSAMMICCTMEELSEADLHLLYDADATVSWDDGNNQPGKESAGEQFKLQEKDPWLRLQKLINDNIIRGTEVPIVDIGGQGAGSRTPDEQLFMLKKNTKYLVKMKLAMCDSEMLDVQTVASMSITPVTQPNDSVLVPMHALESACNATQLVAFGLWDPNEHSSRVFEVLGSPITVEAALCMYTKSADIPIVVKPVATVMINEDDAAVNNYVPIHPQAMHDRWDSAPQWVKAAAVGVQWFYQM